jgi:hypothetical protein
MHWQHSLLTAADRHIYALNAKPSEVWDIWQADTCPPIGSQRHDVGSDDGSICHRRRALLCTKAQQQPTTTPGPTSSYPNYFPSTNVYSDLTTNWLHLQQLWVHTTETSSSQVRCILSLIKLQPKSLFRLWVERHVWFAIWSKKPNTPSNNTCNLW